MSRAFIVTCALVKPTTGLMTRDDELSRRRQRFPAYGRGDKDLYQVKLSLERFIKRATLQHKLVCISIDRMERELLESKSVGCSGAACDAEESWKPWSPNKHWTTDGDAEPLDM